MTPPECTGQGGRGCACDYHNRRRTYAREHRRRERAAALAVRQGNNIRCQYRLGVSVCNARLEVQVLQGGATSWSCPQCARREAGICRDCPRPVYGVVGRALRCEPHARAAVRASGQRWAEENAEKVRATSRATYQENPDVRARRNEYKRLWRKANREKVREQKQRYVERQRQDPNSRYNRYHARYRAKHGTYNRELQKERTKANRIDVPAPKCTECGKSTRWKPVPGIGGRPWTTCNKCCWPHERKKRQATRRRALQKVRELEATPVQVKPPRQPAPLGPRLERLCITPGCDIVVAHRKKKCTRCIRRDEQLARQLLEQSRGRGRRTDLERAS